ncbi:MAG: CopG family transcriptional regulator [Candidatus Limnocylindrales bacterium]
MERTQIYLTTEEAELLDRLAVERKTTRSSLIRDAIDQQYATDVRGRVRSGMRYWEPPGSEEFEEVTRTEPLSVTTAVPYTGDPDTDPFLRALRAAAGIWKDREDIPDGYTYQNRIRHRPGMNYWEPLGTEEDPA